MKRLLLALTLAALAIVSTNAAGVVLFGAREGES